MNRKFSNGPPGWISAAALVGVATRAAAQVDVLLPEDGGEALPFASVHANDILNWTPFIAGILGFALSLGLHAYRSRQVARAWRGQPSGWWDFWGIPFITALVVYVLVCGGVLVWAFVTSAEFGTNFSVYGPLFAVAWLVAGALLAVSPALARLVIR